MKLRHLVHGIDFCYRLHIQELLGKPDLASPSRHAVIFMHGCFWHCYEGCKLARLTKTELDFWKTKLEANKEQDLLHQQQLRNSG